MKKNPITWCNKPGELTVSLTFTATNGSNGSDVVVICPLSTWSSLTRINPTPGMVIRGYSQYLDCSISTCKTWSRNIEDMLQSKKWYLTSKVFYILNAGNSHGAKYLVHALKWNKTPSNISWLQSKVFGCYYAVVMNIWVHVGRNHKSKQTRKLNHLDYMHEDNFKINLFLQQTWHKSPSV